MSIFDPNTFLSATVDGANSTERMPTPVGEYTAVIGDKIAARQWNSRDGTKSGIAVDVPLQLDLPPAVAEQLGQPSRTISHSIMLDTTEGGALDMGKGRNIQLGRLREALGLNAPGQAFAFNMLAGRTVKVQVTHEPAGDGSGRIYERIGAIGKA